MSIEKDINELEYNELVKVIKEHPHRIKYLKEQSEEICEIAVKNNPKVLCLVRQQTENLCLQAIRQEYWTISMVRDLTNTIIEAAIKVNSDAVYYLPEEEFRKRKNLVSRE